MINLLSWRKKRANKEAVLHFSQSRDVEETHAKLYKEAMSHFMEERETTYYVCNVAVMSPMALYLTNVLFAAQCKTI